MNFKIDKYLSLSKLMIMIIDILLLHSGFIISYMIKFGLHPPKENLIPYYILVPVITITFIILFNIYGLYTISMKSIGNIIFSIIISLFIQSLFTMSSTFFTRYFAFPRSVLILSMIIQVVLLSLWRYFIQLLFKKAHGEKNVMIVGKKEDAELLARKLIISTKGWYNIRFIIDPMCFNDICNCMNEVQAVHLCNNIDENIKSKIIQNAIENKKEVYIVPEFREILQVKSQIVQFDDIPTISLSYPELTIEQKFVKRISDIILSIIGITLFSPIMLIAALLIKLTSKGPVIYKQVRITENNKKFQVYKFRTMYENAEAMTGPVLASDDDPRITRIGKFFRMVRIDELPQFFNVLIGDMSFIGPRPERPYFVEQFEKDYPNYHYRHNVKAGITGLAQVMGKYSTDVKDKLRLDLMYIKNYSILLDLRILFLTIKIALTKEASSGLREDKSLDELLNMMDYNVYSEAGVTKLEK